MHVRFRIGKQSHQVYVTQQGKRLYFAFGFNPIVTAEIKATFEGYKWHGYENPDNPDKRWSIPITQHNIWRFNFLTAKDKTVDPYTIYDGKFVEFESRFPLKPYQYEMSQFQVTRKRCILGAGMGTGKTLTTIASLEQLKARKIWWVAPRSALYSVELEFAKWQADLNVEFMTYEGMVKRVANWQRENQVPDALVIDESQRIKSYTSQRYSAAVHLADNIREVHGQNGIVFLLSGTPSPKSPADWWTQCRVACPGFLREAHFKTFNNRLAFIKQETNTTTNTPFPRLVTLWDDEKKCGTCGQLESHPYHDMNFYFEGGPYHKWTPSVNEVEGLYHRLKGLTKIVLKKDVLSELPDKIYRTIECKPDQRTIRAAKLIAETTSRGAMALTLLRELSDGFQYESVQKGERTCSICSGSGKITDSVYIGPDVVDEFELPTITEHPEHYHTSDMECPACSGTCVEPIFDKVPKYVNTPKEKVLKDCLEEYQDDGRVVIWAAYHGSLDRCLEVVKKNDWNYICIDGRGWRSDLTKNPKEMLRLFQDRENGPDKIAVIAHPGSGGTGLTLTGAGVAIYYSNDFSYESRAQSEDRIHRLGMDTNRGATIIDIIHLPSDRYVLNNLMVKKKLQAISMGDVQTALNTVTHSQMGYGVHA